MPTHGNSSIHRTHRPESCAGTPPSNSARTDHPRHQRSRFAPLLTIRNTCVARPASARTLSPAPAPAHEQAEVVGPHAAERRRRLHLPGAQPEGDHLRRRRARPPPTHRDARPRRAAPSVHPLHEDPAKQCERREATHTARRGGREGATRSSDGASRRSCLTTRHADPGVPRSLAGQSRRHCWWHLLDTCTHPGDAARTTSRRRDS